MQYSVFVLPMRLIRLTSQNNNGFLQLEPIRDFKSPLMVRFEQSRVIFLQRRVVDDDVAVGDVDGVTRVGHTTKFTDVDNFQRQVNESIADTSF